MKEAFDQFITGGFNTRIDLKRAFRDYENYYGAVLTVGKDAKILDIGCGTGVFLKYLKQKGFSNAIGIDASREMINFCQSDRKITAEHVDDLVAYLKKFTGVFDFVFLNDVIEHFPRESVLENLYAIHSALKSGGQVVVKTGNTATLAGFYLRYKDFTHYLGYSEYSLKQVLLVSGFEDVVVSGNRIVFQWHHKRLFRLLVEKAIAAIYQAYYAFHYGQGGPTIYSKLLIATARKSTC